MVISRTLIIEDAGDAENHIEVFLHFIRTVFASRYLVSSP